MDARRALVLTQSSSGRTPVASNLMLLQRLAGNEAVAGLLPRMAKVQGEQLEDPGRASAAKIQGGDEELESLQKCRCAVQPAQRQIPVDVDPVAAPSIAASVNADLPLAKAAVDVAGGATPSNSLGAGVYGLTFPESVTADIAAKKDGTGNWVPVVTRLVGHSSQQVRLLPGQTEVTGPGGNTTKGNACDQVEGLTTLGNTAGNTWYMRAAVKKHEDVHLSRFKPALAAVAQTIATNIEATVSTPDDGKTSAAQAATKLKADPAFAASLAAAQLTWFAEILTRVAGDHAPGGPTDVAEHAIADPMVNRICGAIKVNKWPTCSSCP
jgi:hypothetical protein